MLALVYTAHSSHAKMLLFVWNCICNSDGSYPQGSMTAKQKKLECVVVVVVAVDVVVAGGLVVVGRTFLAVVCNAVSSFISPTISDVPSTSTSQRPHCCTDPTRRLHGAVATLTASPCFSMACKQRLPPSAVLRRCPEELLKSQRWPGSLAWQLRKATSFFSLSDSIVRHSPCTVLTCPISRSYAHCCVNVQRPLQGSMPRSESESRQSE
mmetsp:Transcript_70326/g.177230  ORF Transcript_70326/g.177230 Transcript_70326/m.177230 type:complete len:210 (+) Transcript_70326:651-1280(+)